MTRASPAASADEVRELSGQEDVPILVLDDGEVVTGNQAIVEWARSHPA